jgi:hypothetical protein
MFSIALFDSVRANLNETSDQLNSLSALPEIMHLYRYSKFSSLLTSLSRQGKFQLIILQSLSTPFPICPLRGASGSTIGGFPLSS